jgi:outer membrane protein assembly factor BamB
MIFTSAQLSEDGACLSRALIFLIITGVASSVGAGNWPQFRGSAGGYAEESNLPLTWNAKTGENILWKTALPKADNAYSSPIVWGDRVFYTYAINSPLQHHAVCVDRKLGHQLWDTTVEPGPFLLKDLRGGYGAPTPATDGQALFVVFGSAVIAAIDFNGKLIWRVELEKYNFDVAMGSSPVVYKETVVLLCDQVNKTSSLIAFDKKTGKISWEQKRPQVGFAHSTPVLINIDGQDQLLVSASNAIQGINPQDGTMLWWCSSYGDAASPASTANLVYADSGRGGKAVAVDPRGKGDVTKTHLKWTYPQIPEGLSSPIIATSAAKEPAGAASNKTLVYRTHNPELLKCIDAADGQLLFAERLPGISTWASPFTDKLGRIYFASAGKSYVVDPGPKLLTLATNDLAEDSRCSAAVSDGQIFIRGDKTLFCIARK